MSNVFLTRVWGYTPTTWPILGFGKAGGANKFQREYATGDWVALSGTHTEQTRKEEQGRLLGLVQVTNMSVDVFAELQALGTKLEEHCFVHGEFKWPTGFPYLTAFSFVDKPLLIDVLPDRGNSLARAEAAYAMRLEPKEAEKILALDFIQDDFPFSPSLEGQQNLKYLLTQAGPPPSHGKRVLEYEDGDNSVYVFRLAGTNFYKVGRSNDINRRLMEFNTSPHAVWSGKKFDLVISHTFPSSDSAHKVEQLMHQYLKKYSKGYECFAVAKEGVIEAALGNMIFEYSHSN